VIVPTLAPEAVDAIRTSPYFAPEDGVLIDTGSYGETRPGSISLTVGTPIGERVRQLVDTADAYELMVTLVPLVGTNAAARRAIHATLLIEVCNLVELTLLVPDGRHDANRYEALVDLVPEQYAERADLSASRDTIDLGEIEWLRRLRDTVAAHVDPVVPFRKLYESLMRLDLRRLERVWLHVEAGLGAANRHPASLVRNLFMRHARLSDVSRVDTVEHPNAYDE